MTTVKHTQPGTPKPSSPRPSWLTNRVIAIMTGLAAISVGLPALHALSSNAPKSSVVIVYATPPSSVAPVQSQESVAPSAPANLTPDQRMVAWDVRVQSRSAQLDQPTPDEPTSQWVLVAVAWMHTYIYNNAQTNQSMGYYNDPTVADGVLDPSSPFYPRLNSAGQLVTYAIADDTQGGHEGQAMANKNQRCWIGNLFTYDTTNPDVPNRMTSFVLTGITDSAGKFHLRVKEERCT